MSTCTCHTGRTFRAVTILSYILLLAGMCALASCHRGEEPVYGREGMEIDFDAIADGTDETKAPIGEVADLLGDGFAVWASWTKDPDDEAIFTSNYKDGFTNEVFGLNGTKVYATEVLNSWYYTPKRFWYRGTYVFAAALPASIFNASHARTPAETIGKVITASIADNNAESLESLSMTFAGSGFALGGSRNVAGTKLPANAQADLMYAFASVDNKDENAGTVPLNFTHACSLLGIKLTSDSNKTLKVKSVKIFGIHKSAMGLFKVTPVGADHPEAGMAENTARLRLLLKNASTEASCFAEFTRPAGTGVDALKWDVAGGIDARPVQLVEELIVFPEVLDNSPLKIKVTYDDGSGVDKYLNATVPSGSWEAGKGYVYTLSADSMEIGEPEVTEWVAGEKIEIDIE